MNAIQLELDFRSAIAYALAEPEAADLRQLWRSLEPELAGLTQKEQLSVAGQALCDLAEVCQRRAELMWVEWEDHHNTDGPIPRDDFLHGLVQKSMHLDISALIRPPKSRKLLTPLSSPDTDLELMDSEVVEEFKLLMAGTADDLVEEAIVMIEPGVTTELEHDEDIAAWANAIRLWMESVSVESVSIGETIKETNLSAGKVWLAALLSDLELHQTRRDFYSFDGLNLGIKVVSQGEVA
jgi:hypothetical protein